MRIDRYDVYRRRGPFASPADAWDYAGVSIRADSSAEYSLVVGTLGDSSCTGAHPSAFIVRAASDPAITLFDSPADSGSSLDNLPPAAPIALIGNYSIATHTTHLHWLRNSEADFATYHIHRDRSADFVPGAGNLIATQADTGYADPDCYPPGCFYKISAMDTSCNASPYTRLAPWETSDVSIPGGVDLSLPAIRPNPSYGDRLVVDFTLGTGTDARLELIDVAGRMVMTRSLAGLGPGRHAVDLSADERIPPGFYRVRLAQGERCFSRSVCVLR